MKKLLSLSLAAVIALTALTGGGGTAGSGGNDGSGGSAPVSSGKPKQLSLPYKGDIATLDMNLCYDSATAEVICNTVADYIIPRGLDYDENGKDFRDTSPIPAAYDVEKGKEYWEQAKKELNLPEYTLRVQTGESPASKTRSEFFQSQMEKNLEGLTIEFDYITAKTGIENEISGDFDTTFSTWNVDYLDLSFFIDMFTTGFYANTGRYSNPEFDRLAELANGEYVNDKEKRWDALRAAEQILVVEDMGVVPIYQESKLFLVADRVAGYHQSVITPTRCFANMDIVE